MNKTVKRLLILAGMCLVISIIAALIGGFGLYSDLYSYETGQRLTWVFAFAVAFGEILNRDENGR